MRWPGTGATTAAADGAGADPYSAPASAVTAALAVDPDTGLTAADAAVRLHQYGQNRLTETPPRPAWKVFGDQLHNGLFLILLGAAALAVVIGNVKDAAIITAVVLLNAVIGFSQERKATRSLAALKQLLVLSTLVRRDGKLHRLDADELVPGDLVELDAGSRVPADGRLLRAHDVHVDQASLTGESEPVSKSVDVLPAGTALPERANLLHAGTTLTRGRAEMVVTATGMSTEVGRIAGLLDATQVHPTPLQVQLDAAGRRIVVVGVLAVAAYSVVAMAQGDPLADVALRGVALAVAAVPEGLPAVLALVLAIGVHRMAQQGAIVRRLASVETLGAATVLCTDKTGTLTRNQMTVREVVPAVGALTGTDARRRSSDADRRRLLASLALCNNAYPDLGAAESDTGLGDPMEVALITAATREGINVPQVRADSPRVAELPFSGVHKLMATIHRGPVGRPLLVVKGAPDVLLDRCSSVDLEGEILPRNDGHRVELISTIEAMASRGLRILAAAERELSCSFDEVWTSTRVESLVEDLTLLGVVGIADPPRVEAVDAVAICQRAGIDVKMVTGDYVTTARVIAAEVGITGRAVTGADLDAMTPDDLAQQIDDIGVFARVTPSHKLAIVTALSARGHIVGMTGDGVNDVAAVRAAHVGIAMGRTGTDVTKDAADMVLTDDNFATIVGAVRQGRGIYDSIIKFVRFQLTTNIAAILTFLAAALIGLPAPMTAVQVLWVNLITDGPPALALGLDRPGRHVMDRPSRPASERILSWTRLWRMAVTAAVMAAGTLAVLTMTNRIEDTRYATTLAFTTFVLFQVFNALNVRDEKTSAFSRELPANRWLLGSLALVVALQVAVVHVSALQNLFGTVGLQATDWLLAAAIASLALATGEADKLLRHQSHRLGRPSSTAHRR